MGSTVWDQEFFRRRAAGEQAVSHAREPAAATPLAPRHATIAELLLARAGDDNTALLFEDQRWSWRELVTEAATRSAFMQQLRPRERPWLNPSNRRATPRRRSRPSAPPRAATARRAKRRQLDSKELNGTPMSTTTFKHA